MKSSNWAAFPWKTALGVAILVAQAYVYYRSGHPDLAATALGLAFSIVGVAHNVAKDQEATHEVKRAVADLHQQIARSADAAAVEAAAAGADRDARRA